MNEIHEESKLAGVTSPDTTTEVEIVRKPIVLDRPETGDPDDPRTPTKVDRTEPEPESRSAVEDAEFVRKPVALELIEECDPDDSRTPTKVDRTKWIIENVTELDED